MNYTFPFSAVVASEDLKLALLLVALDPKISGVLIEGEKGTAKTTLARALGELLPAPARFVELPLGASEDRVKGAVDLAHLVKQNAAVLKQGLLGQANGGVLYVDEVNLLADHLVDMVLDAAATGVNRVERDSISISEPANFVLIGSMNKEEGWLRPQLLDRFGLYVRASSIDDIELRLEATKRRLAFDADPESFCAQYEQGDREISDTIARAREKKLSSSDGLLSGMDSQSWSLVGQTVSTMQAGSLRADLVLVRAACAYAFWLGEGVVASHHVEKVAPLVFAHRSRTGGNPPGGTERDNGSKDEGNSNRTQPSSQGGTDDRAAKQSSASSDPKSAFGPSNTKKSDLGQDYEPQSFVTDLKSSRFGDLLGNHAPNRPGESEHLVASRRGNPKTLNRQSGLAILATNNGDQGSIDALATLKSGVVRSLLDVNPDSYGSEIRLDVGDFYRAIKVEYQARLIIVVLDTSGSMGLESRIALAREVLLGVLEDSYKRRNRVSLVTFSGAGAKVLVSNAKSVELVQRKLGQLRSGGLSPIALGLNSALEVAVAAEKSGLAPEMVVITDGRATSNEGDAWEKAKVAAQAIAAAGVSAIFIDLEMEHPRLHNCEKLARFSGGRVLTVAQ